MTTITAIFTGVAAHIGIYTDAVAASGNGIQIFVSGMPGLRENALKDPVAHENGRPRS